MIDLRSDTVTRPTAAMLEAMTAAPVGDDVLGDDPTVQRLERHVAGLLGKAAAVYVPSGTMANQCALGAQTRPGDLVVLEAGAHVYRYEGGSPSALWGLQPLLIPAEGGLPTWTSIAAALPPDDVHFARPALLCLENTHNTRGGRILPQADVEAVAAAARERGLRVHLDGARLWNAHVASGVPLETLAAPFDTVSVCFSKGLGAPVGSCLAGDDVTISVARRIRKRLGGGMRQSGLLAAACLHALDHHLERLADDHARARRVVAELDNPLLSVNHGVDTNIVNIDVAEPGSGPALADDLARRGVAILATGPAQVRLIPNLGVDDRAMDAVIEGLNSYREEGR